ncbi:hypothetical protein KUTeg_007540 [Tegillarca granosa]|uniref:Peroxin-7 n=1 Tax=Tegillarca granosa TaxID=220873 RepID=A0ABQ9FI71_TEGGR|nr:hypothetical protein KUTeg_007540 [Tegillarca granosa]
MQSFQTKARHGYSVEFSPYFPQRFACAACQHYGIAGTGTLYVIDKTPNGLQPVQMYQWNDGLFDVTWAENNENVLVTATGDGAVLVWDTQQERGPIKAMKEHTKEVYSVHWSQTRNEHLVLSGSWDTMIKLWDIGHNQSLKTFRGHTYIVYSVRWSPHIPGCFASASESAQNTIQAHNGEILTCDWCKYDQFIIFTGGVDCAIRGWDIRKPKAPICELPGHKFAVRRVKVLTWDFKQPQPLETIEHHTEFVYGLDFNIHTPGEIVDCGWDELVHVYTPKSAIINCSLNNTSIITL